MRENGSIWLLNRTMLKLLTITRRTAIKTISAVSALSLFGCNQTPQEPANADALDETPEPIDLPLALLRRLHEIGDLIEAKFPNAKGDSGMGKLGLMLSRKLRNGGYFCTPTNSLEFGRTGG